MSSHDQPPELFEHWRRETELDPLRKRAPRAGRPAPPATHKEYPDAPILTLPEPRGPRQADSDLWTALAQRRTRRQFTPRPLPQPLLADLLWACQGVTARHGPYLLRTAPSAGALYPFETYVSLQNIEATEPCLVHLHVPSFSLEVLDSGNHGRYLAQAALGQSFLASAAAVFVWTAVLPRCAWKYGPRALRYLGLDLGHVCQNLTLACTALGLECCPVAAFVDREINQLLEVDGADEFAYYLAAVGAPPPDGS